MRFPASPESRTGEAVEGPLPQSLFQASPLPRAVRPPMGYIDSPAAAGVIPHAVRPGMASAGTSDAPVPEGRYRDRGKPAGPNTVSRTAAPALGGSASAIDVGNRVPGL